MSTGNSDDSDLDDVDAAEWKLDLVSLMLDPKCDFESLRSLCQKRHVPDEYRVDVWRICLHVNKDTSALASPEHHSTTPSTSVEEEEDNAVEKSFEALHTDSLQLMQSLGGGGGDDDSSATSLSQEERATMLESVEHCLRRFATVYKLPYFSGNGWLDIMRILLQLKLSRDDLYAFFVSIHHRFVVAGLHSDERAFDVFHLLLQYHEPQLSTYLDNSKVSLKDVVFHWVGSLFASSAIPGDVLPCLWDIYFLTADPFMVFALSLVLLVQAKEAILNGSGPGTAGEEPQSKEAVQQAMEAVCGNLKREDLEDFFVVAEHYLCQSTPASFIQLFTPVLFGNASLDADDTVQCTQALALPVTVQEVLSSVEDLPSDDGVRRQQRVAFLLVDCRSAEEYNAGHLPTAHYLDPDLLLKCPNEFQNSLKCILSLRQENQHLCLMGVDSRDSLLTMVIAQFLQRQVALVSILMGGYQSLHEALGPQGLQQLLSGHDAHGCQVCCQQQRRMMTPILPTRSEYSASDKHRTPTSGGSASESEKGRRHYHHPASSTPSDTDRSQNASSAAATTSPGGGGGTTPEEAAAAGRTASMGLRMGSMLSRFSQTVKSKGALVKERVVNYVKNDVSTLFPPEEENDFPPGSSSTSPRKAASSGSGRAYRNTTNVFSIDDEEEEEPSNGSIDNIFDPRKMELVTLESWRRKPNILFYFPCHLLRRCQSEVTLSFPAHLLLTKTDVFILLDAATYPQNLVNRYALSGVAAATSAAKKTSPPASQSTSLKGMAYIGLRRALKNLLKITSHRKMPELIGLHYGLCVGGGGGGAEQAEVRIQDKDRLLFPTGCAGEATKEIKMLAYTATSEAAAAAPTTTAGDSQAVGNNS